MLTRVNVCSVKPNWALLDLLLLKLMRSTDKYLKDARNKRLVLRGKLMRQTQEREGGNSPTLLPTLLKTAQLTLSLFLAGMPHQAHYEVTEHFKNGCLEMLPSVSIAVWYIAESDITVTPIKVIPHINTLKNTDREFLNHWKAFVNSKPVCWSQNLHMLLPFQVQLMAITEGGNLLPNFSNTYIIGRWSKDMGTSIMKGRMWHTSFPWVYLSVWLWEAGASVTLAKDHSYGMPGVDARISQTANAVILLKLAVISVRKRDVFLSLINARNFTLSWH